jgi:hypothetical protein
MHSICLSGEHPRMAAEDPAIESLNSVPEKVFVGVEILKPAEVDLLSAKPGRWSSPLTIPQGIDDS